MTRLQMTTCPGCGLDLPESPELVCDGYFHTSPECWSLCTEVLGREFGDAVVFGQAHQLTVDAYAVQHAGGPHPDKSVAIHLSGLHLMLEGGQMPASVPKLLQRIAGAVDVWPHFPPPDERGQLTVCDVALAGSPQEHIETARAWAASVWSAWSSHHAEIAAFVARSLG